MLEIKNLTVEVDEKKILRNINLEISDGKTYVLFGPNGSGKTTLLMTIMGFKSYKITEGKIYFMGEDITDMPTHERAKKGIGIMFQRPPTIQGLKMIELLNLCKKDDVEIEKLAEELNMEKFLNREVNKGFSGGEIKRSEILQLLVQNPELSLIDEPESGVDLESISLIGKAINKLLQKEKHKNRVNAGLIITHTGYILDYVRADTGYLMLNGEIKCKGNPYDMLDVIKKYGYNKCLTCMENKI